ncbi:oligopeptide ABC transporter substrate-binding protein OppA [Paraphotobacterium marinum]|uniref:Oligopeptide ABC transporter substrate-binding protein OppA n=1 Tax=Paraphotobacterium marinum TaxID=1755811 RepID=A0A220VHT2_9GAMM|nr:peptide ABC transporter substrate-binding protein [Paraphotobacterium marinum]ASK79523.1 oligopeptide ABC transporter substrate-binding protein OppA [Paraphotobacterium marinum]
MNNKSLRKTLIATALLGMLSTSSFAANVPAGTELAKDQTLTFNNQAEPQTLDPQLNEGAYANRILDDLLEGLVNVDGNGNPVPGVAKSWEESKDGLTYTFHLRKDSKWSDGSPVTAKDFVYSWERLVDPKTGAPYAYYPQMGNIVNAAQIVDGKMPASKLGVVAKDDYTLVVKLEKPTPFFIGMLSNACMFPVQKATVEKWGDKWTKPEHFVGNGAYKLSKHVVNEKIVSVRNPKYWDNKNTVINKVVYLVIPDRNQDLNRYKSGGEDISAWQLPGGEVFKQIQANFGSQLKITPFLSDEYALFNTKVAPFNNVKVRKAISLVINKEALSKYVMGGATAPQYNFAPAGTANFSPIKTPYQTMTQEQRIAMATKLLNEAGYNASNPLKFSILYSTSDERKKEIEAVAAMISQAVPFVKPSIEVQEWKTYLSTLHTNDWQMSRNGWVGDYNDPMTFYGNLVSGSPSNYGSFSNKKYDDLIQASYLEQDLNKRKKYFNQMQEILSTEYPAVTWFQTKATTLVKPYVKGYPMNNALNYVYSKDLYLVKH